MFLEEPLIQLGLTQKEAKIYLALLELGQGSVQDIAQKSQLKRPTVYVILTQLQQKGFAVEERHGRGSRYSAVNPEIFRRQVQEQATQVNRALPFLQTLYKKDQGKPQVQVYEGIEGIKQVYYDQVWPSKTEILFFSSIKNTYAKIPGLLEYWTEVGLKHPSFQKQMREFINPDPIDIAYAQKAQEQNPQLQVRIIPKNFQHEFIGTDNAIFEDKIMMVSFEQKLFTTVIQSQPISNTLRTLYELAWQSGTSIV